MTPENLKTAFAGSIKMFADLVVTGLLTNEGQFTPELRADLQDLAERFHKGFFAVDPASAQQLATDVVCAGFDRACEQYKEVLQLIAAVTKPPGTTTH